MYEMEGASSGSAAPDQPVARLPRRFGSSGSATPDRPVARLPRCSHQIGQSPDFPDASDPPARARHPFWIPVSRPPARPPSCPGVVPVSCGESISTRLGECRARAFPELFWSFLNPHAIHRSPAVIRMWRRLSTGLLTANPQVTGCNVQTTRIANFSPQSLFSWFSARRPDTARSHRIDAQTVSHQPGVPGLRLACRGLSATGRPSPRPAPRRTACRRARPRSAPAGRTPPGSPRPGP